MRERERVLRIKTFRHEKHRHEFHYENNVLEWNKIYWYLDFHWFILYIKYLIACIIYRYVYIDICSIWVLPSNGFSPFDHTNEILYSILMQRIHLYKPRSLSKIINHNYLSKHFRLSCIPATLKALLNVIMTENQFNHFEHAYIIYTILEANFDAYVYTYG